MLRQYTVDARWSSSADAVCLRHNPGQPTLNGHAKALEPGSRQPD